MPPDRDKAARELLAFYQEAGVDALLGEAPVDRFADAPPAIAAPAPPLPAAEADRAKAAAPVPRQEVLPRDLDSRGRAGNLPPPSPDAAVMAAREAAKTAASLDELRAILGRFDGCALKATATQLVFADGNLGRSITEERRTLFKTVITRLGLYDYDGFARSGTYTGKAI